MILVRDVLRLKFGKAKEAKALAKVGTRIAKKVGKSVFTIRDTMPGSQPAMAHSPAAGGIAAQPAEVLSAED